MAALCVDELSASHPTSLTTPASQDTSEASRALTSARAEAAPLANVEGRVRFLLDVARPREDAWLGLVVPVREQRAPGAQQQQAQQQAQGGFGRAQQMFGPRGTLPGGGGGGGAAVAGVRAGGQGGGGFHGAMLPPPRPALPLTYAVPVAFHVRRWDLLPDQGSGGAAVNDTAISLGLFGTRKV
jgi:mediator of RNA polymerase II transcription subunit 12